ncbi:MAG: sialate O-acetylesterase [Ignavibacteria bacterium]|jgi:hypothetical protein
MKKTTITILAFIFLASSSFTLSKDFKLYYLGGQSNMVGYGKVEELPAELNKTFEGVMIFHGNTEKDNTPATGKGIWDELKPGHGRKFETDGVENHCSKNFGVEISFADELLKLEPENDIAIIKYAKGGTSIDKEAARKFGSWDPDYTDSTSINQYDHFLATVRNAISIKDIDNDGEDDNLIPSGIIWMQGESDADVSKEIALRYEENLKVLMNLIRAAFRDDNIPVVIGQISDSGQDEDGKVWDYFEIVTKAQNDYVKKDKYAAIVNSTENYGYHDKYHYDSAGYIDFGREFARAVYKLK